MSAPFTLSANISMMFAEHAFPDRIDAAARAGFRAVEWQSVYSIPARDLAARLASCGLVCNHINVPTGDPKLGKAVEGGAGPDGDIVGFTTVCPHKGFPLSYNAESRTMNCPGHYSVFDCEAGGQQTWGQATQNLPQYMLRVDDKGDIYAEGVDELLYGRLSNVL